MTTAMTTMTKTTTATMAKAMMVTKARILSVS
jgi:hypothetical protein